MPPREPSNSSATNHTPTTTDDVAHAWPRSGQLTRPGDRRGHGAVLWRGCTARRLLPAAWTAEIELQDLLLELIGTYGDPTRWPPLLHHLPPRLTVVWANAGCEDDDG